MRHDADELVITAAGVVTAAGFGAEAHWQLLAANATRSDPEAFSLKDFKPAPYLSDRRMLKAVSADDAIGLVGLEGAIKDRNFTKGVYPAERIGLYVGAPTASTFANEPYMEALTNARFGGTNLSLERFGTDVMDARPTTLLLGLPNNVLCYGAMLLDARGPNSNYTSSALSGHLAVINAARRVRRGALDLGVAGAFAAHTEPVNWRVFQRLGLVRRSAGNVAFGDNTGDGMVVADGSVFLCIERRDQALARGGKVLGTIVAGQTTNDGLGPVQIDARGTAFEDCIRRAFSEGGITSSDCGLVLANAGGVKSLDSVELAVLTRIFGNDRDKPALGSTTAVLGTLMEAGGLFELAILPQLADAGELPKAMQVAAATGFPARMPAGRPYVLVLRASPWGEYSAIVARMETA